MLRKILNSISGFHSYITIGLGIALITSLAFLHISNLKLENEKQGRANDKLTYQSAQTEAAVKSYREVLEVERKYAEEASKADASYAALRDKYNVALLRYAEAQRKTNIIHLSSTSETTDGSYTSSDSTDVLITLSDANICAENTARLQAVREWALRLK